MKINDEGTSNAAHWYERAMKAESRLAEADALLRDIAEMRVTAIPSMFMDESMAAAARAYLSHKEQK